MKPSRIFPYAVIALLVSLFIGLSVHVSSPLNEDDPGWNCYAHGNQVCGAPEREAIAWQAWDASKEAERLDPSVAHRVEYVGAALTEPSPHMGWITVSWGDGHWYVFRAEVHDNR